MIDQEVSDEGIVAFDPSYIPRIGKSTYGKGRFWSGVAGKAKWGLDISGFAVVDIGNNTAVHLKVWQTPSADKLAEKGLNLVTHYASLVTEYAKQFKAFLNYIVADAWFSKRPSVEAVKSTTLEFISRLRDDSVLKYKYTGERTGKKGAPKKFDGLVDAYNFNPNRFSLYLSTEEITSTHWLFIPRHSKWTSSWPLLSFTMTEEKRQ